MKAVKAEDGSNSTAAAVAAAAGSPGHRLSSPSASIPTAAGATATDPVAAAAAAAYVADRRGSLGLDAFGDALFGRRPSGFGLDAFGGDFGLSGTAGVGTAATGFGTAGSGGGARRGSLDSTAVLDAAIMDLTRRRLSMAMGAGGPTAGPSVDPSAAAAAAMNDPLNLMGFGLSSPQAATTPGAAAAASSSSPAAIASAAASNAVQSINAKQEQLQNQQKDLERRQKELEMQRQQLLTAMDERRKVMQQMQSDIQKEDGSSGGGGTESGANPSSNLDAAGRNSLLGSLSNPGIAGMGGAGTDWNYLQTLRRSSLGGGMPFNDFARRSSLDLLGALTGPSSTIPAYPASNPNAFQQQIQEVHRRLSMVGGPTMADVNASLNTLNQGDATSMASALAATPGPYNFTNLEKPLPLSMPTDKDWLTPLHCFVRQHCVEVFTATEEDVATPSKGKRKPIHVGQVGIRCPYAKGGERGSVYYPTSISSIYNATMNLLQRHFHNCKHVPAELKERYDALKADDARSGTSKKYWIKSALSLGLVDTATGIRYSATSRPPLPSIGDASKKTGSFKASGTSDEDFYSNESNALTDLSQRSAASGADALDKSSSSAKGVKDETPAEPAAATSSTITVVEGTKIPFDATIPSAEHSLTETAPLVMPEDKPFATSFSYHLLSQMQPCVFTEADRLGKRKGLPPGFPGLACRHCFGGYGSGRFFPSSIKTLSDTSKTLNVLHNHMQRCRKCPTEVRDTLKTLHESHDKERAGMKFGSQKAFFARIWDRLHYKDPHVNSKRKFEHPDRKKKIKKVKKSTQNNAAAGNFAAAAAQFQQQNAYLEAAGLQAGLAGFGGYPGASFSGLSSGIPGAGIPGPMPTTMQDYLAMQQYAAASLHPAANPGIPPSFVGAGGNNNMGQNNPTSPPPRNAEV